MNTTIDTLIAQASTVIVGERADGKRIEFFNPARGMVNGHKVEVAVIEQLRRTTSRAVQVPSFMFKVDGKRVSKANLSAAIA